MSFLVDGPRGGAALEFGIGTGRGRAAAAPTWRRGPRHRHLDRHGRAAPGEARLGRDRGDDRRLRHDKSARPLGARRTPGRRVVDPGTAAVPAGGGGAAVRSRSVTPSASTRSTLRRNWVFRITTSSATITSRASTLPTAMSGPPSSISWHASRTCVCGNVEVAGTARRSRARVASTCRSGNDRSASCKHCDDRQASVGRYRRSMEDRSSHRGRPTISRRNPVTLPGQQRQDRSGCSRAGRCRHSAPRRTGRRGHTRVDQPIARSMPDRRHTDDSAGRPESTVAR